MDSYSVTLCLYDLSMGMAKALSPSLLGKQIDGIWHTSVVVYNAEYFYGGGVCVEPMGSTPYGSPTERMSMGQTTRSPQEFLEFLAAVTPNYTMETYHLLKHNCNHFTEEVCRFLVGKNIPDKVKGLTEDVLSTPIGKSFEPMINSMMLMKNTNVAPVVDRFAEYLKHSDLFSEYEEVVGYVSFDDFVAGGGLLVYWDPSDEASFEISEKLGEFAAICRVGCLDCLRHSYLKPQSVPWFVVLVEGHTVNECGALGELEEFKEDLRAIFRGVS